MLDLDFSTSVEKIEYKHLTFKRDLSSIEIVDDLFMIVKNLRQIERELKQQEKYAHVLDINAKIRCASFPPKDKAVISLLMQELHELCEGSKKRSQMIRGITDNIKSDLESLKAFLQTHQERDKQVENTRNEPELQEEYEDGSEGPIMSLAILGTLIPELGILFASLQELAEA